MCLVNFHITQILSTQNIGTIEQQQQHVIIYLNVLSHSPFFTIKLYPYLIDVARF